MNKDPPTYELWVFGAINSFKELEEYCRANWNVWQEIVWILTDETKGVEYFVNSQIPKTLITHLVCCLTRGLMAQIEAKNQMIEQLRHENSSMNYPFRDDVLKFTPKVGGDAENVSSQINIMKPANLISQSVLLTQRTSIIILKSKSCESVVVM